MLLTRQLSSWLMMWLIFPLTSSLYYCRFSNYIIHYGEIFERLFFDYFFLHVCFSLFKIPIAKMLYFFFSYHLIISFFLFSYLVWFFMLHVFLCAWWSWLSIHGWKWTTKKLHGTSVGENRTWGFENFTGGLQCS